MKKIMSMIAVASLAVASQAASYTWKSTDILKSIDAASVVDNGNYAIGTVNTKNNTSLTCVLELYSAGELIGSSSAVAIKYGTTNAKINNVVFNIDAAEQGASYDYIIKITGTDNALTARGKDTEAGFDYTSAQIAATFSGTVNTLASGATTITSPAGANPSSWAVSGITALTPPEPIPPVVPEPTSGLLLVLGMAGLALKRKLA